MKQPGPLFTLAAGVLLAAGIATANYANDSGIQPVAGSVPVAPAVSTPPSAAATPEPGASAAPSAVPTDAASASAAPSDAAPAPAPLGSAPVETAPPKRANYAGRVKGGGASIAVSVQGDRAIAYLCDGRRAEAWLNGDVAPDGTLDLKNAKGDSLTGVVRKKSVAGTVTVGAKGWRFSAPKVARPAGLYRAIPKGKGNGEESKAGWIVQPDGSQVGVITTGTTSKPAPHLDFGAKATDVDGTRVTVEAVEPPTGEAGTQ